MAAVTTLGTRLRTDRVRSSGLDLAFLKWLPDGYAIAAKSAFEVSLSIFAQPRRAVYGGRWPGAPRKWSPKNLRRLLDAVNEFRAEDPTMKETRCCELLSKGIGGQGRYKGKNAKTLRRVLQKAKALDRQAQLLATPVRDILRSETAGAAKGPKTN
jgi:hypothetical protein